MSQASESAADLILDTSRLILRPWDDRDYAPFAEMNRDPEVMRYFPKSLTLAESNAMIDKVKVDLLTDRHGFWAVEEKATSEFLGFVALARVQVECPSKGEIEIGWRLRQSAWGKGFASEGAVRLLEYGFVQLHLNEIVSLTSAINERSRSVMERIGMKRNSNDDFEYRRVPVESPIRSHILYRLKREEWVRA